MIARYFTLAGSSLVSNTRAICQLLRCAERAGWRLQTKSSQYGVQTKQKEDHSTRV